MRSHTLPVLMFILAIAGTGCSDRHSSLPAQQVQAAADSGGLDPAGFTQPLPQAGTEPREVSALQTRTGDMSFSSSSGAAVDGMTAILSSTAGSSEWVIYEFYNTEPPPQIEYVEVDAAAGADYYIGISNYSEGRWQFHGPFTDSQQVDLVSSADSFSSGTNTYVAVLSWNGAATTVNSVSISLPSPLVPLWYEQYGMFQDDFFNNVDETMHGLTTDSSDNVYVLSAMRRFDQPRGSGMQLLRYDKDGTRNLAKAIDFDDDINPSDIAVDSSGNIYLLFIYDDLEMLKLDSAANLVWAKSYSYDGGMEELTMRIDSDDNLLVCGTNDDFPTSENSFLAKFDTDGELIWGKQWEHASFFFDVELAVAGTNYMVLADAPETPDWEIQYPRISSFDKDGNHLGSRIITKDTDDEPIGSAWGSESITARNGQFYVGGMAQAHIEGEFTAVHQVLVINPDLSVDRWFSGDGDVPGKLGLQSLDMAFSSNGDLYMIGNDFSERFALARFGSDDTMTGAWTISGDTPTSVMVEGEYNQDGHRAVLARAPGGGIFIAGTTIDSSGLTLLPGGVSSHVTMGRVIESAITVTDLAITSTELSPVFISDAMGVVNTADTDDEDTLVMRVE